MSKLLDRLRKQWAERICEQCGERHPDIIWCDTAKALYLEKLRADEDREDNDATL